MKSNNINLQTILCCILVSIIIIGLISSCQRKRSFSKDELGFIGEFLFNNECSGRYECLTAWNEGEEFASFGIGHFIWYPETEKIVYEESFPQLIAFMSANDVNIPKLLYRGDKIYMPWTNRAEFINDFNGLKMLELRRFLAKTIDFQVLFMIERMESTLARITAITEAQKRETVKRQFYRMYNSQYGVYSLIDYINFKGAGVIGSESYNGYGWGLRQVLENMEDNGEGSEINDFVKSAKFVLKRRVINSPKERNENRWLKGWLKRVGSYTSIGTETGIKK